jgi:hypothetical protein
MRVVRENEGVLDASALETQFEAVANFPRYGNLPADH